METTDEAHVVLYNLLLEAIRPISLTIGGLTMTTEYDKLAEIEEREYQETMKRLNNLEVQARTRGHQKAIKDFQNQNEQRGEVKE